MKRLTVPLIFVIVLSLCTQATHASSTTHTYFFSMPRVETTNGVTAVIMDGTVTWGRVGYPLLPYAPVKLLLPPGEEAVTIYVETADPIVLGEGYRISHRLEPYPLSMGPVNEPTQPDEAVYSSDDPYPTELAGDLQTQFMAGHGIAYAAMFPVSYRPVSGELIYYPWLKVTVESQPSQRAQQAHWLNLKRTHAVQERLTGTVQNPEMSSIYGPQAPTDPIGWDMLLITTNAFAPGYQDYVDYKNISGIMTVVETVEDIYSTYPGSDNQMKIRNCIIDYYQTHSISYVFICGDDEHVPCRPLYCSTSGYTDDLPGDLYYAGLDGNWNNDGDNQWGEPGEEDYIGEVAVGRSCADTGPEINNFNNKNMMYQTDPVTSELERALMTGEDLGWPIWAWEYKEEIRLGSSNWGYTTVGFPGNFQVATLYETPGNSWSAMTDLLPLLNQGPNMVNHLGHANYDYVMQFYTSQITDVNFTNDGTNHNFFIGYSQGCMCGGFDQSTDCIIEAFTTIGCGAVAFVGNSRYGWGDLSTTNGPSQHFDRQFFDALFAEDITTLGWMNQDSKEENIWLIPSDNTIRWCYYELNLFGDPTLDVWTAEPGVFTPTYNSAVLLGSQTFQVSALPQDALVTISMENVVIGQGEANATGVATITFDQPLQQLGILDIYVTQHDMLPYFGTIQVIPPSGPYVIYSSSIIEDAVTGNGNGQLDYSEAVELTMTVENVGVANAIGVTLTLSSTDPIVTITDPSEYLGDINAGMSGTVYNGFALEIGPDVEDGYGIQFMLSATDGVDTWESYFVIVAHAPEVVYASHYIQDPTGNNNHNLDPGETADIEITMTNEGSCFVEEVTIDIATNDPYVTTVYMEVNIGLLQPGESATGTLVIIASPDCPQEYVARIFIDIEGTLGYNASDEFDIIVGDILYNPTGPDNYGYTAYDPFDAPEMPVYEWVEICADSGGPGELVNFTSDDQVLHYLLPFAFQYYGSTFDSLTVATNGWIAPGIVREEDYSNSGIPNADGPEAMIAPYWEDLSPQRTNSGKVWQWYDATEHRLIVEYNHVEQYAPTGAFETFQVILFDPAYYQTGTGDGRILFQYKQMSNSVQSEGTIGIENPAENDGLQILFDGDYDQYVQHVQNGLAILFSTPSSTPQFNVDVTYISGSPVPASGGYLELDLYLQNLETTSLNFDLWIAMEYEGGTPSTLALRNLTFPAGHIIDRPGMMWPIPSGYAAGNYMYWCRVGAEPIQVWAEDGFPFVKSGTYSGSEFMAFVPDESLPYPFDVVAGEGEDLLAAAPEEYSLGQNYPNPFNPLTTISFGLLEDVHVNLSVYNINGQVVATLVDGVRDASIHEVSFDASQLSSGIYFYRIEAGDFSAVRKMVLMK